MEQTTAQPIGDRVRDALDARGLRYQWVAARIGMSQAMLSRVMSGERRLTPLAASRLAELLKVPVDEFRDIETGTEQATPGPQWNR